MNRISILPLSLLLLILTGISCGGCKPVDSTPSRPEQVRGWRESPVDNGIVSAGEFVVKKGSSVENGKLGITILKIDPVRKCSGLWAESSMNMPEAKVRFYRVADKSVLLEVSAPKASSVLLANFKFPIKEYGIDTIFVHDINTKEEWVWFDVWK